MDLEAIKNAEAQVANIQATLDDAQRILQVAERAQLAAERAQQVAERSTQVMRTVALAAIAGLVVVALTVRRSGLPPTWLTGWVGSFRRLWPVC